MPAQLFEIGKRRIIWFVRCENVQKQMCNPVESEECKDVTKDVCKIRWEAPLNTFPIIFAFNVWQPPGMRSWRDKSARLKHRSSVRWFLRSNVHLWVFSFFKLLQVSCLVFKVTTTECKKQLSFRSEEKCGTKPDKECRIKTKIVQVPEEQIKLVCFLFSSARCHPSQPGPWDRAQYLANRIRSRK